MLEFQNYSERNARKEHRCDLCGEIICVGEKYVRFSYKYDGLMFDQKLHLVCNQIISEFCRENDEEEYTDNLVLGWVLDVVCSECEHSSYGDGKDDCETSIFHCKKVINRFCKKQGDDND